LSFDTKSEEDTNIQNDNETALSNWDVSGYIKVLAEIPTDGRDSEVELDDLSLFVSGNINEWFNPFVEAEYFSGAIWQQQGNDKITDGKFIFERLYNDFELTPDSHLRVGKFLARIGYWNLIHAAPLVWTVNRPASSTYSYSNYITGIEYGYEFDAFSGSRFDIYLQVTDEFDAKPLSKHPREYDKVLGSSWTINDNIDTRSSIDFQYAEVKDSNTERLTYSFQKVWYLRSWDIDTQLIYTRINVEQSSETSKNLQVNNNKSTKKEDGWDGGGYVQARYRFTPSMNAYARGEYFHYAVEGVSGHNIIVGSRYILGEWGNLNIEYKWGSGATFIEDDGFSLSYNAMFRW
jgi:hypothetical protein